MSKRKRAERFIGKVIETKYHGPARVLAVAVKPKPGWGTKALCFQLEYLGPIRRHTPVGWEPVTSRLRYKVHT